MSRGLITCFYVQGLFYRQVVCCIISRRCSYCIVHNFYFLVFTVHITLQYFLRSGVLSRFNHKQLQVGVVI